MPPRAESSGPAMADSRPRAVSVATSTHHHHDHNSAHSAHRAPTRRVSEAFPHRPAADVSTTDASETKNENMRSRASSTGTNGRERTMWCSWCLEKGPQTLVKEGTLFGRDKWKCQGCWGMGKMCIMCGGATAKEYSNGDTDKLCMSCSGGIPKWGHKNVETEDGWCSWCFHETTHELVQKNVIGRNVYKCGNGQCGRRTLKCTDCLYLRFQATGAPDAYSKAPLPPMGFARGDVNEGDDKWCAVHDGTIEEWGAANPEEIEDQLARERYCSWCIQWTVHRIEKIRYIGRDTFVCGECSMPTLVCYACDSGMAMGGSLWDDRTCVVCQGIAVNLMSDGAETMNGRVLAADESMTVETLVPPGAQVIGSLAPKSPNTGRPISYYGEMQAENKAGEKKKEDDSSSGKSSSASLRLPINDDDVAAFTGTWERILTRKFNTYLDMFDPANAAANRKKSLEAKTSSSTNEKAENAQTANGKLEIVPESEEDRPLAQRRSSSRPNMGILANGEKWESLIARKEAVFTLTWGPEEMQEQLARHTPEREKALEAGMIRPFLYLVSMSAPQRNRVANLLGWSLVADASFGDPHKEAWEIIRARTGFLGRAQEFQERIDNMEPDWLTVMQRVFNEIFPGEELPAPTASLKLSRELSRSPSTTLEPALEEQCLHILVEFSKRQLTREQLQGQKDDLTSDEAKETMATISQYTDIKDVDVLQYGTLTVLGVNELKKTKQVSSVLGNIGKVAGFAELGVLATPLAIISSAIVAVKIGQLAMGSSSSRLFGPSVMLLQQRLALGAASLDINEFY